VPLGVHGELAHLPQVASAQGHHAVPLTVALMRWGFVPGRPDQPAAREFLARHSHLRVARLGELVRPLDHPALVAVGADGQLLGMPTYVPGQDGQYEILTLHVGEQ
jgi:hypothetical protein